MQVECNLIKPSRLNFKETSFNSPKLDFILKFAQYVLNFSFQLKLAHVMSGRGDCLTCTLDSGRLIFSATSSLMKMSG